MEKKSLNLWEFASMDDLQAQEKAAAKEESSEEEDDSSDVSLPDKFMTFVSHGRALSWSKSSVC